MHIDNLHIIVCNIMNICSVSPFCSSIPVTCMSSIMLNVRPQGRKIANATPPYFPSLADGNSVFQTLVSVPRDGK